MAALGIARASAAVSQAESFSGSMRRRSMLEQMQQEGSAFRSSLRRLEDDSQAELEYARARMMTTGQTTIERAARGRNLARDKEPEHTTKRSQRGLSRRLSSLSDSLCSTGVHAHKDHFHDPSEAITFIPASATVERDGEVEIFLGDHWKRRHAVLTRETLYFTKPRQTRKPPDLRVLDKIELRDIARMDGHTFKISKRRAGIMSLDSDSAITAMMRDVRNRFKKSLTKSDKVRDHGAQANQREYVQTSSDQRLQMDATGPDRNLIFSLSTLVSTDHAPRTYMLRANTRHEREQWLKALAVHIERETSRAVKDDRSSYYHMLARNILNHSAVRSFFALAIMAAFAVDACESQLLPLGRSDADSQHDAALGRIFHWLELAFTVLFGLELVWTIFSYWFWEFFSDMWNIFDFAVVVTSIISVLTDGGANLSSVRMARVLRVLRVIKAFQSLRKIVAAITMALWPMLSALVICCIAISVFAILGVNAYATRAPLLFGDFEHALWTLANVATLDNWTNYALMIMSGDPKETPDKLDAGVCVFFISYVIIVSYVLTSVVIAVLLDNFTEASHAEEEADMLRRQREECQDMMAPAVGSVLDPLLAELAQAETLPYLQQQIDTLFRVLDVDESGVISFDEMQLGLQALDVRPRIQLSRQDFLELTRDGAMLDAHGCVSSEAFNQMINSQICNYITRSLFRQGNLPQNERALSSVFAGLSWLLMHSSTPSCRCHLEKQQPVGSVGREENGDPRFKPVVGNAHARGGAPTSSTPLDKLASNSTITSHDIQVILQGLVSQAMHQIRSDVVKSVQDGLRDAMEEQRRIIAVSEAKMVTKLDSMFQQLASNRGLASGGDNCFVFLDGQEGGLAANADKRGDAREMRPEDLPPHGKESFRHLADSVNKYPTAQELGRIDGLAEGEMQTPKNLSDMNAGLIHVKEHDWQAVSEECSPYPVMGGRQRASPDNSRLKTRTVHERQTACVPS